MLLLSALLVAPAPVPVDFRCDQMRMTMKPRQVVCEQNVVVRRGDWVLCCERFEGSQDKRGAWQRLTCGDNVRAQRGDELMWGQSAVYLFETTDLIVSGDALLRRPTSLLRGDRIVVDTSRDQAHIERPRGRLEGAEVIIPPLPDGLPERCPVGPRP
jgi:lipopolysaccharide export system protein LptA